MVLSAHGPVDDPASLISTSRLQQLFNDLRQRYDFIVLNAPATLAVRDARAISEIADTTLMVVDWGKTTVDQARAALEILERSEERRVGKEGVSTCRSRWSPNH